MPPRPLSAVSPPRRVPSLPRSHLVTVFLSTSAMVALACWSLPHPAHAQDEAGQRQSYEQLTRQAREKRQAAQKLRVQERGVLRQLHQIETNLSRARMAVQFYTNRETRLARDIAVVERDLSHTRAARTVTQDELARRLRAAYRFRQDRELELLMSSRSFADLDLRMRWVGVIAHGEERMVRRLGVEAESINVARIVLQQKKAEITQVRAQKEHEKGLMEGLRAQRQRSVHTIQNTRLAYEAAASELERSAQKIKKLLEDLERRRKEEERRRAQLGQPVPGGQFGHGRGSLPWPVRGNVIAGFGKNRHPVFGTVTINNGIDIQASEGAEIHSVEKGTVEFVDWIEGYGQTIIVNHGSGFYTLYAHCGDVTVAQGQQITAGQLIAHVGDTGSIRGPELYFEVRRGSTAVDPMDWLR